MTQPGTEDFRRALSQSAFVARVVEHAATGSTNDDLHALAASGAPEGTVVVADTQTAGRGRLERTWHSPAGVGLYLSTLHRPRRPADELARWTLAAAVAACEACREVAGVAPTIKWPNDVLANGRKLAGILAEARTTGATVAWLVVGAGFNVNHRPDDFPADLRDRAISLRMLAGGPIDDRRPLARAYIDRLGEWSAELGEGKFDSLADAWQQWAPQARGTRVRWRENGPGTAGAGRIGITRGLDRTGALRIEAEDGSLHLARIGESVTVLEER